MNLKKLGKQIKTLRKKAGFNQDSFAEKVGIGYRTLQRIEAGQTPPDIGVLEAIAKVLSIPSNNLIDSSENTNKRQATTSTYIDSHTLDLSSVSFSGRVLSSLANLTPFHRDFVLALTLKDFSFLEKYEDADIDEVFQEILKYS